MLTYHPSTDFFHCWMRFAALLLDCESQGIELDRIRIIDFLLCFPHEIAACRLPAEHSVTLRHHIRQIPRSYEDASSIRQGFSQMRRIQGHVAMDMVAKGIVRRDEYREGILIPNAQPSTCELLKAIAEKWEIRNHEWYPLAVSFLRSIPLNGKDGLKDRSSLLEFRYDE